MKTRPTRAPREPKPKTPKMVPPSTLRLNLPPTMPLGEAKECLVKGMARKGGCFCPLCGQQSTIYGRNLNASIVRVMRGLALWRKANGTGYASIPDVIFKDEAFGVAKSKAGQGGQWAQACFWDLVERQPGTVRADSSNRTGFARITDRGLAFLAGRYRVRKYALVYDATLLGKKGDPVSIDDVKELAFDYREIFMGKDDDPGEFPDEPLWVNQDHFFNVSSLVYGNGEPPPGVQLALDPE
jgi:hypothetical protein